MNIIFLRSATTFTPLSLFAAGEEGVWYDPSDMTTLWQDTARTTQVTAVEQTVACIDDKSGNGNNATQTTSGQRPVLRARYNLLTRSEEFTDAAWRTQNGTTTADQTTAPDGTTTADLFVPNTSNVIHRVDRFTETLGGGPIGQKFSIYAKANGYTKVALRENNATGACAVFELSGSGTVIATHNAGVCTTSGAAITSVGDSWYRIEATFTMSNTTAYGFGFYIAADAYVSGSVEGVTFAGDGTSGVYIWGADVRWANESVGLPVYQRIAASTSYNTTDFPPYLVFDGSDDGLATSAIDFSGTDAVSVFAGVRKLSDSARGTIVELTASAAANDGAFHLTGPNAASATYAFESKGTALTDAVVSSGVAAQNTSVLTAYSDISADQNILRVNGTQVDSDTGDQGTGNFSNAVLYVGRRGGASLPFNGRLYGLIVRGAASSAGEISSAETWMAGKTGVTL